MAGMEAQKAIDGHPLREDVSLNIVTSAEWRGDKVILFVRM